MRPQQKHVFLQFQSYVRTLLGHIAPFLEKRCKGGVFCECWLTYQFTQFRWNSTIRWLSSKKWKASCCFQESLKHDQIYFCNEEKSEPVCFLEAWGCAYTASKGRKYIFNYQSPILGFKKHDSFFFFFGVTVFFFYFHLFLLVGG